MNTSIFKSLFTIFILLIFQTVSCAQTAKAAQSDIKEQAYALYNTNNLKEAKTLLNSLPLSEKDEEVFVILANIEEDEKNVNGAIDYLNNALSINPEYYKAYYNLGCIFLNKKAYSLAEKNLLLAIKYNKNYPYSYYNLGTLYLRQGEYNKAKKNFLKAIFLKPDEKDFYLNLAYAYKFLGKEKEARKILDIYNGK